MKKLLIPIVAGCALPLMATLPEPITYFSFDEMKNATQIANLSGDGNDLTLGPGASLTNLAAVGKALWFDGTQSAYAQFFAKSVPTRTISFWIYRSSDPGPYFSNATDPNVFKQASMPMMIVGLNSFNFRFNNGWLDPNDHSKGVGSHDVIAYFGSGGSLGACYPAYLNYPQATEDHWVHFAYVLDQKSTTPTGKGADHADVYDVSIYINGEKWYAGKDLETTNSFPSATACLGNANSNGQRPCHGAIDELKVFDQALTEDQIKEECARGRDAMRYRLIAWYPMQEFSDPDVDGNFTTPDKTAFGLSHNTTLACSSATTVVPGPNGIGKAIHFDGTATTHAVGRVPYQAYDFTVALWVNVSTNTSILRIPGQTANYPKMLVFGTTTAYFDWGITSTKMQFVLPSKGGGSGGIHTFPNNGLTGKGNWQHMTLVVRNVRSSIETVANQYQQHLELYLNGEFVQQSVDVSGQMTAANSLLILGSDGDVSSNRPFEGDISDFRIYDGAMSADDVRRLFRDAADVDAGEDVTVKGARAVLCGTVAAQSSSEKTRFGYEGAVSWSLVSAPAGGEGVAFLRPSNPVCEVDLPVEGTYVFQLETKGFLGAAKCDTVTVVRDDASGEPSVVPAVDVATVASNAEVRAGLKQGLIRHWSFNGSVRRESVSGVLPTVVASNDSSTDWSKAQIVEGVTGNGVAVRQGMRGNAFMSNYSSGETCKTYGGGCQPDNEWLTISAWIKPESDYPNDWFAGVICHLPLTLSICYGKYYNPTVATGPIPGLSILQTGIKGYQAWLNFDLPAGAGTLAGKWSHVTALVNRWKTADCEFYLDGVKLTEDTTHRSVGNYGVYTEPAYSPFNGKPCGGRYANDSVVIGNTQNEIGGFNNTIFQTSNTTTKAIFSRHFPGSIDEVRLYSRKLTEVEIRYLATHPDPNANAAPVVAAATVGDGGLIVSKDEASASAAAADDGNPAGTLTYEWVVLKGNAANVQFADRTARETQVTFLKKGDYTLCLKASDGERVTYGEPKAISVTARGLMVLVR